jgi:hypothetical protein
MSKNMQSFWYTIIMKQHPIYDKYAADEQGNLYSLLCGKCKKCSVKPCSDGRVTKRLAHYGVTVRMHRFTWECFNGTIPDGIEIDHIDRVPTNNNLSNLRLATSYDQKLNQGKKKWRGKSSSQYKGVSYCKSRNCWEVHIKDNKKQRFLGYYDDELTAAKVYDDEAKKFGHITNANLGLI